MYNVIVIVLLCSLPILGSSLHATSPMDETTLVHELSSVDVTIELRLYPNPTTDLINIEVQDLEYGAYYEFRNIIGKRLLSGTLGNSVTTLNIEEYNKGIYLVSVFDAKGNRLITKKVLKK